MPDTVSGVLRYNRGGGPQTPEGNTCLDVDKFMKKNYIRERGEQIQGVGVGMALQFEKGSFH